MSFDLQLSGVQLLIILLAFKSISTNEPEGFSKLLSSKLVTIGKTRPKLY